MNVYDVLTERGFIKQVSHPEIRDILGSQSVTFTRAMTLPPTAAM